MPRTVKVRIAVAVDATGDWAAYGQRDSDSNSAMEEASGWLDDYANHYWLTAELEVPEAKGIVANVQKEESP